MSCWLLPVRVSEALAVETRHFINSGRTIVVEQQVAKNSPRIVRYLKTNVAKREIDLHPEIAEYLRRFTAARTGLFFRTRNGTPHLYGNLEDRWLTPRLAEMKLDEKGMGFHAFKRFRKTNFGVRVAWRTSTISGWLTNRKRCPNCTRIFTRNWNCVSMKRNESAMVSLLH
jgi:hypothetical protein